MSKVIPNLELLVKMCLIGLLEIYFELFFSFVQEVNELFQYSKY